MEPSMLQTLTFLFGIAFQHYLNYDHTPPIEEIRATSIAAYDRGERYQFPVSPPTIVILPYEQLQKKAGCESVHCGVLGWYSFGAGEKTIYMSDLFTIDDLFTDPYVQSVYIHESTHYLQDIYGAPRVTCEEQWKIERDAYNTQFKYLSMKHYASMVALPTLNQFCGPSTPYDALPK